MCKYIYIYTNIGKYHVYIYIYLLYTSKGSRFTHITGSLISRVTTVTGCSSPNDATQVFVGVVGLNFSAPRVDKDSVADVVWHSNEPKGGRRRRGHGGPKQQRYPWLLWLGWREIVDVSGSEFQYVFFCLKSQVSVNHWTFILSCSMAFPKCRTSSGIASAKCYTEGATISSSKGSTSKLLPGVRGR